ncbi:hypothetical protein E2562_032893 [Oryza meyeriana var. granulata]|uniref:Uncharacterized protein n=1 Tax=Oryza meyeriana var. granulata TaxID=110450 RepID=A0A6G1F0P7_9ORYZ|nr:hypothetical protein E2562_032893 [Oryza meyeriana var. granulata]
MKAKVETAAMEAIKGYAKDIEEKVENTIIEADLLGLLPLESMFANHKVLPVEMPTKNTEMEITNSSKWLTSKAANPKVFKVDDTNVSSKVESAMRSNLKVSTDELDGYESNMVSEAEATSGGITSMESSMVKSMNLVKLHEEAGVMDAAPVDSAGWRAAVPKTSGPWLVLSRLQEELPHGSDKTIFLEMLTPNGADPTLALLKCLCPPPTTASCWGAA